MNDKAKPRGTILCLVNSAAYSRSYFVELAPHLKSCGYDVRFALDSHLSDVVYADGEAIPDAWYFTDFLKQSYKYLPTDDELARHTWSSLLPDFDRFLTLEIPPPLGTNVKLKYRHIPALLARFFDNIFEAVRPAAILYEPVSNAFAIAAYRAALASGIPFCSLSPSRIPGRIELSMSGALGDDVTIGSIFGRAHAGAVSNESRALAADYISTIDTQVPDYMKINGLDQTSLTSKYLKPAKLAHFARGLRYRRHYRDDCAIAFQHGDPLALSVAFVKRAVLRRLRLNTVHRYYQRTLSDEPFLLYPLHFHPEASTSVLAGDFMDELSTIKAIAFRLPSNITLYVKEHPSAVALQPISFYRQLDAMPNVRLLAPELATKNVIRRSRGVITLTSTVGFEAAVLNKPVVTLGNIFYNYFPNVRSVRDYSGFSDAIRWALEYTPISTSDILEATAAYVEFGAPGSFDFFASLGKPQAFASVTKLIVRELDRRSQQSYHAPSP